MLPDISHLTLLLYTIHGLPSTYPKTRHWASLSLPLPAEVQQERIALFDLGRQSTIPTLRLPPGRRSSSSTVTCCPCSILLAQAQPDQPRLRGLHHAGKGELGNLSWSHTPDSAWGRSVTAQHRAELHPGLGSTAQGTRSRTLLQNSHHSQSSCGTLNRVQPLPLRPGVCCG